MVTTEHGRFSGTGLLHARTSDSSVSESAGIAQARDLAGPGGFKAEAVLALQRSVGNAAVGALLSNKSGPSGWPDGGSPRVNRRPIMPRPNNTGLPDSLKSGVESLSGVSLGDVTVHYQSPAPGRLQASAFTGGTEIHVAPGGEHDLPHEALRTNTMVPAGNIG